MSEIREYETEVVINAKDLPWRRPIPGPMPEELEGVLTEDVNKSDVNRVNKKAVNKPVVNTDVNRTDRKAYMLEYMRRKRAV